MWNSRGVGRVGCAPSSGRRQECERRCRLPARSFEARFDTLPVHEWAALPIPGNINPRLVQRVLRECEVAIKPTLQKFLTTLILSPITSNSDLHQQCYALIYQVSAAGAGGTPPASTLLLGSCRRAHVRLCGCPRELAPLLPCCSACAR